MIYIKVSENGMLHTFDCTVSDSVRYETVKFDFPKSWDGYTKTAVFRNGDIILSVILNSDSDLCVSADECYIPHEVIKAPEFTVSVFGVSGDSRVTASQAAIRVIQSGYGKGGEPSNPTPSEYEQLITLANETKEIAQSVRTDADNGVFKGAPFTYDDFTPEQLAGLKGTDGYTPQKGVDYFTPEDIAGLNIPKVDQSYDPESLNAQSGKAVAEAVASKANITYVDSSINELNSRFPSIKTVMDEVAVAGAQYYLGEVTELNITLPEDGEIGQEIAVSWYNGETASTLAIDGVMLDFDYTPSANTRSEISCLWDGTYWSVIGMSQDVPSEVVASE